MSTVEPDVTAYNEALLTALRSTDPARVRQFAATWGANLGNRGLKSLAAASDDVLERRMWMMISDRPDLAQLHPRAEQWLETHDEKQAT